MMSGCSVVPSLETCCFCMCLRWSSVCCAVIYMVVSVPLMVMFGTPIVLHRLFGVYLEYSTLFFFYIVFISLVLQFVAGIVLIIATVRKSPIWMWPWIVVSFLQSAALIITAVVCTFVYIYQVTKVEIDDDLEEPMTYAAYSIYGFLLYYATSVVNSYKRQLSIERAVRSSNEQTEMALLNVV